MEAKNKTQLLEKIKTESLIGGEEWIDDESPESKGFRVIFKNGEVYSMSNGKWADQLRKAVANRLKQEAK